MITDDEDLKGAFVLGYGGRAAKRDSRAIIYALFEKKIFCFFVFS
jgi:hypothetical protein